MGGNGNDVGYCGFYRSSVLRCLQDSNEDAKCAYIQQICDLRETGALYLGIADELAAEVTTGSLRIRACAAQTLSYLGSEGTRHAAVIASLINDNEMDDPYKAQALMITALALGRVGAAGAPFAEKIASLLGHEDNGVASAACGALGDIGPLAVSQADKLSPLFKHRDLDVRCAALDASGKMGANAEEISTYLSDENGRVRCAAAVALGSIGKGAEDYAPEIVKLMGDSYEDTDSLVLAQAGVILRTAAKLRVAKCAAVQSLRGFGATSAVDFLPKIADMLQDENSEVRLAACEALGALGAEQFEQNVIAAFADKNVLVRSTAVLAVGEMAKARKSVYRESMEEVAKMLKSQHPAVRNSAAKALGMMGAEAGSSAGDLLKCLNTDRSAKVQISAMHALGAIGPKGQVYAGEVAKKLYDADDAVREGAIAALPLMGQRGGAYFEEIAELLGDQEAELRGCALQALGKIGQDAQPVINLIDKCRSDPCPHVRMLAAEAVGNVY